MNGRLDIVVPYPASNSSVRTRSIEWVRRLERRSGDSATPIRFHGPGFDGTDVGDERVLLLRNARRFTRGRHEAKLLARACLGVYDLDDGLPWDDGNLPGLGRWWKRPWPRSLVARRAASAADRVIAGNDTIASWASAHCRDVRVIPTCVEPGDYRHRTSWAIGSEPVVGWIGSPATQGYLLDIAEPLREIHRRTHARVEIVGADESVLSAIGDFVTVQPWDADTAGSVIADWDVGLMPLRDGLYERAKCGYKLLQYAASGVPAVGSPVGVNESILRGMEAPAPNRVDEWADAVVAVLEATADRRAAMASAGDSVAAAHSYDRWFPEWLAAIGEADS